MLKGLVNNGCGGYCGLHTQTSLKVSIGCNGAGTSKFARCRQRYRPHPIRRGGADRAVLSTNWFAGSHLSARPLCSKEQPVQCQRMPEGFDLSAGARPGANRNDRAVAAQRSLSLFGRLAGLPRRDHLAALPRSVRPPGTKLPRQVARRVARADAGGTLPSRVRFGHYGADGLRPSGRSRGRLQPPKARPAFLSSPALLRGEHAGLLGGQLPSRGHPRLDHHHSSAGARLPQVARVDPRSESSCRRCLLRSRNRAIYRGETRFLRHRGPAHPAIETPAGRIALPPGLAGSVGRRVSVLSARVAGAASLRRDPPTGAGRTFGPTDLVPDGRLQLPSFGHQPCFAAPQPLAVLQSPRAGGIDHPRIEVRLRPGEDSDEGLASQRGVLPDCLAGVQPAELVQTSLCPSASAAGHPAASSPALVRGTGPVGATGPGSHSASCAELPLGCGLHGHTATHWTTAVAVLDLSERGVPDGVTALAEAQKSSFFTPDSGLTSNLRPTQFAIRMGPEASTLSMMTASPCSN